MKTTYAAVDRLGRQLGVNPTRRGPPCPDCATVMEPSQAQSLAPWTAFRVAAPALFRYPLTTWECPLCGVQTPREQG